jgi:RNA polymerase sigma factor (sigma-70 family)
LQHKDQHINQLLSRCKNGEKSAQLEIYKRYYRAMYNTALRILNNSFDAEDMMQESFLIAFTKLGTFKGEVTFGAWLKRIVINKCLTQLKKNKRLEEVKLEVAREESIGIESHDYTDVNVNQILNTINQLKENYRVAITLHLIEGFDYEEVSQIMNISYENSRTTVSRAKNKLRQLLCQETITT